ncbi:MAG: hypothetical protein H0T42_03310, partial [Deltaproteobacteria bacterium]|nr:hypothetical protein [Deltaproteobacteria bacterium]
NYCLRRVLGPVLIALVFAWAACGPKQPPVPPPGPAIPADPVVDLREMDVECDALVAALRAYKSCENLDEDDQQDLDGWIERATKDFAAGRKARPEPNGQRAIALACLRATKSVQAATERCHAGPPPKDVTYGP